MIIIGSFGCLTVLIVCCVSSKREVRNAEPAEEDVLLQILTGNQDFFNICCDSFSRARRILGDLGIF